MMMTMNIDQNIKKFLIMAWHIINVSSTEIDFWLAFKISIV